MKWFLSLLLVLQCSLFAEEQKKLRFFNLDLHVSVIADLKQIFDGFGHEVVDWSLSGHNWVFGKERDSVEIVNETTWMHLDREMCDRFYERYKDFLSGFDGFIVTHTPALSLLYAKLDKPIIIVNSTRYEQPFSNDPEKWAWLNGYLKEGVEKGKIFIVSNNKGDQLYLKSHAGIESEWIPSLCLYTHAGYTGAKEGFIVHPLHGKDFRKSLKNAFGRSWKSLIRNRRLPDRYDWQTLYDFKGIVHFPYQISTMSLFEQYSANVPLFFPSKKFLASLHGKYPRLILSQLSYFSLLGLRLPTGADLNNVDDPKVIDAWIGCADYYDAENMPYIQYFDSFKHLKELLLKTDCKAISRQMKEHNEKRKQMALNQWKALLDKVGSICYK